MSLGASAAQATEPRLALHVEASAARSLGDTKSEQFGWGGLGAVAPELVLTEAIGIEIAAAALALSAGSDSAPPEGVAATDYGFGGFATVGPRIRPLARARGARSAMSADGIWLAGGLGAGITSGAARPAIRTAIGFDVATEDLLVGPFVGFVQIVESDSGSVRPDDARVATLGVHVVFGGRTAAPADPPRTRADTAAGATDPAVARPADRAPVAGTVLVAGADSDHDGISDHLDACAHEAETDNDIYDDDGCPDAETLHVDGPSIVLDERVHFAFGSTVIAEESDPLFEQLTTFLRGHPEYRRVHVGGHADDIGPEDFNMKISRARASAVVARLVASGIDPQRLTVVALGEARPALGGTSDRARRANRRVELTILERATDAGAEVRP